MSLHNYILQYVRATQNSIGSNVETALSYSGWQCETHKFAIREESAVAHIPAELNLARIFWWDA